MKKTVVKKKMDQMMSLLELMDDLARSGDCVVHEMQCATVLLKGLHSEVAAHIEKGD
ncbi:hypothetical protein DDM60_002711 [Vibrio cholerae]|uniref:hypothetical protein n=1 Tax=Vibrio cholerae TaxID=666 RepID=UPI001C92D2E3|nr:hypothetical protein [Vibrio cholerae]ELJ8564024.1 hypothetical protein [Vibrio cholerae]MBY4642198.1 hypothetical protein [Vibrio cholerae]MCR9658470.1 hypothetical protein [Vibrio cholerae]MCR9689152.1 hypothetical protein [Vibrio cholerae]MCR9746483.1 hypothetical protein [Vibrio cholerae]